MPEKKRRWLQLTRIELGVRWYGKKGKKARNAENDVSGYPKRMGERHGKNKRMSTCVVTGKPHNQQYAILRSDLQRLPKWGKKNGLLPPFYTSPGVVVRKTEKL